MKTPDDNNVNFRKRPSWTWYIISFILIGLIIWYLVGSFTNNNANKLSDPDLNGVKTNEIVDTNNNNIIDGDDLLTSNAENNYQGVGELAQILALENVTNLTITSHLEAGYTSINGRFIYDNTNALTNNTGLTKGKVYTFSAVLNNTGNSNALTNFYTIVNNRQKLDSNNKIVSFYESGILTYVDYTTQTNWTSVIMQLLLWVVIFGIGFYFISRLSRSVNGMMGGLNSQQMNFNSSRARRETHTKVKFSDVAGCDEVKAELVELVDYFRNGKAYTRLGAKLPRGFLLVGPPGTGKTLLAKAVAGEANVPFYSISGSDFVEMYVGVGAGRVRDMFKVAKQNAPCLIFIDEIDAVGRQRGAGMGGGNDEREQTLNQLLVEMDGFEDNSGVIVMAATNRADVLDPALTRAGRFDRQITVDLPDKEGREAILKVHARNKVVSKSVDFAAIASRTVGFSGADLANILNDAAILAVREKKNAIDMDDIDEAIDRSIAGPAKTNRGMSEQEKRRVAYHESGHAVIGIRLQHSEKVQRITIIPRGRTGGHVLMTPESDRFVLTKEELIAQITGLLGGRTSEEIFFGDVSTGASNDIEQATRIARMMVTEYGMSDLGPIQYEKNNGSVFLGRDYTSQQANYSTQVAYEIDKAVRSIINQAHDNCKQLLLKYKDDVELIANTLIKNETITAEQIDYLLEHRKLPEKEKAEDKVDTTLNPENTDAKDNGLVKEVETPQVKVEEKLTPVKEEKPLSDKAKDFVNTLHQFSSQVALICLFVETDDGRNLTSRQYSTIIKNSTADYIDRTIALGETASDKLLKGAASLIVGKQIWSEFSSEPEEFGKFVEDTSGIEVVFIKINSDTYIRLSTKTNKGMTKVSTTKNSSAKKLTDDLKQAVDNEDKDKKDKK